MWTWSLSANGHIVQRTCAFSLRRAKLDGGPHMGESHNEWTGAQKFEISNPSSYERSDYVEVDLKSLGVPPELDLDKKTLKLFRIYKDHSGGETHGESP